MLSRTVLKHHYKDCGSWSPSNQESPLYARMGFTKQYWQSLTSNQRTQLRSQYFDRLDGGES
ncbi:hypothetical protein Syn7502_02280 [Synechococcus sp. PCC 7502]|uniref:hypothetical protein n=1 Tax=Synechococcus sp. PCC 7502 TaxID=1173263 RepID=UPI00029F8624|nr:hypothetical protein [Synechococcus sp. PCC 7502]AFY73547.1 hypothetical protein Syn7502_01479 [Synechococcus sp. PCC 7502]AFY74285.1 hypothetical protein Syn7502_02280 [Synechococcus sp. PCC 7502]